MATRPKDVNVPKMESMSTWLQTHDVTAAHIESLLNMPHRAPERALQPCKTPAKSVDPAGVWELCLANMAGQLEALQINPKAKAYERAVKIDQSCKEAATTLISPCVAKTIMPWTSKPADALSMAREFGHMMDLLCDRNAEDRPILDQIAGVLSERMFLVYDNVIVGLKDPYEDVGVFRYGAQTASLRQAVQVQNTIYIKA